MPTYEPLYAKNAEENLLRALGSLVVSFSALEEELHDVIALVSGEDPRASVINILTAGLNFRTLVEKFGALYADAARNNFPEEVPRTREFCSYLDKLNEERNAIIHSAWMVDEERRSAVVKRGAKLKSGGFSFTVSVRTAEEVYELARKMDDAGDKLWELTMGHGPEETETAIPESDRQK